MTLSTPCAAEVLRSPRRGCRPAVPGGAIREEAASASAGSDDDEEEVGGGGSEAASGGIVISLPASAAGGSQVGKTCHTCQKRRKEKVNCLRRSSFDPPFYFFITRMI